MDAQIAAIIDTSMGKFDFRISSGTISICVLPLLQKDTDGQLLPFRFPAVPITLNRRFHNEAKAPKGHSFLPETMLE